MENKLYIDCPKFTGRNVPITEIAKAIGKDAQYGKKPATLEIKKPAKRRIEL